MPHAGPFAIDNWHAVIIDMQNSVACDIVVVLPWQHHLISKLCRLLHASNHPVKLGHCCCCGVDSGFLAGMFALLTCLALARLSVNKKQLLLQQPQAIRLASTILTRSRRYAHLTADYPIQVTL